uniref:Uncharacterized protein n=1 Tax=Meloidogyne enterolobii TaxID=390850 RepID=A0A6V7XFS8_MELEN|nr:unnamed protein product [Meloidogyne enterolobii]CAD2198186.1 unnamed protein product [Meloidogyne enterolobii]
MKSRLSELDLAKKKAESAAEKIRNVVAETGDKTAEVTTSAASTQTPTKRALPEQGKCRQLRSPIQESDFKNPKLL